MSKRRQRASKKSFSKEEIKSISHGWRRDESVLVIFSTCSERVSSRDITVVDIENKYKREIYFMSFSTIFRQVGIQGNGPKLRNGAN